jgi:hypothetical protein
MDRDRLVGGLGRWLHPWTSATSATVDAGRVGEHGRRSAGGAATSPARRETRVGGLTDQTSVRIAGTRGHRVVIAENGQPAWPS